jgi:hypothetical protein
MTPHKSWVLAGILIILIVALGSGLYLVNFRQTFKPKAACTCYPEDENVCRGVGFNPSCNSSFICFGTKDCSSNPPTPMPTTNPNLPWCNDPGDQCEIGGSRCQQNSSGINTGYQCNCVDLSPGTCKKSVWQCNTQNTTSCPQNGGVDPSNFSDNCSPYNAKISGRCFVSLDPTKPISAVVNIYKCPNTTSTSGGCQQNLTTENRSLTATTVCFPDNYCGVQQMDISPSCFMSVVDQSSCNTSRVSPSSTPTPTPKPTATTTPRPTATNTPGPTATNTPGPTATNTPGPTATPGPNATPTPTSYITQGPTPTPSSVQSLPKSGASSSTIILGIFGAILIGLSLVL